MLLIFLLFWIVLNGRLTLEIFIMGVLISLAIFGAACHFLDYSFRKDLRMLGAAPFFVLYLLNLLREMFFASLKVMRFVLSPKYVIEPTVKEFDLSFETSFGHVMMANYITLTPGTITVDVVGDHFTIHCLDAEFDVDPENCRMVPIIRKMEELRWTR